MNFELNEEQQMLADTVERLVRNTYSFEQREVFYQSPRGASCQSWALPRCQSLPSTKASAAQAWKTCW